MLTRMCTTYRSNIFFERTSARTVLEFYNGNETSGIGYTNIEFRRVKGYSKTTTFSESNFGSYLLYCVD